MSLDLEKDCSFLVQVGTRSLGRGEFLGSGQRSLSEIRGWKGGCNPRCGPVWIHTLGDEVAGGSLGCVHEWVLCIPTQLHSIVFCAHLVFLWLKSHMNKLRTHAVLQLFPDRFIPSEQICVSNTSIIAELIVGTKLFTAALSVIGKEGKKIRVHQRSGRINYMCSYDNILVMQL